MNNENQQPQRVRIVGIDIPFLDLLVFFIKAALAAVPALIIVGFIYIIFAALFVGFRGAAW